MQNLNRIANQYDRTMIQGAKVSRITPNPCNTSLPLYYNPPKTESSERSSCQKLKFFKTKPAEKTTSVKSILSGILDFLRSDEGILLLILLIIVIEGTGDEILIILLVYILLSGNEQFQKIISQFKTLLL